MDSGKNPTTADLLLWEIKGLRRELDVKRRIRAQVDADIDTLEDNIKALVAEVSQLLNPQLPS